MFPIFHQIWVLLLLCEFFKRNLTVHWHFRCLSENIPKKKGQLQMIILRSSCFSPEKYECQWSLKYRKAQIFMSLILNLYAHFRCSKISIYMYLHIYICKLRSSSRMTDFTFEPISYQHWREDIHRMFLLNKLPFYLGIFYNFNGTWNGNKMCIDT